MSNIRHLALSRRHPDLVAVYESPRGQLALLLRHTLVPLAEERAQWRADTRRVARAIVGDLRAGGVRTRVIVLQWRPIDEVAQALQAWKCRYDGDQERRKQLTRVAARQLADRRFLASRELTSLAPAAAVHHVAAALMMAAAREARAWRHSLAAWYRDMAPSWLGAEPALRRDLILRAHWWLVEHALGLAPGGAQPAPGEARHGGLMAELAAAIPAEEIDHWRGWLKLVTADIERALRWPAARRGEAWARWLLLIPYSIPLGGQAAPHSAAKDGGLPRTA